MEGDLFYSEAEKLGAMDVNPFWQETILNDVHYFKGKKVTRPSRQAMYKLMIKYGTPKLKRRGEEATSEVEMASLFDGLGGVCFGLCILLLELKFNYDLFEQVAMTPVGVGKIRGFQNAQGFVGGMDKAGKHLEGEEPDDASKGHIKFFEQTFSLVSHLVSDKYSTTYDYVSAQSPMKMVTLLKRNPGCFFPTFIYGDLGGHATLVAYTNSQLAYFDPNLGLVTFKNTGDGSVFRFCQFLKHVTKKVYLGELDKQIDMMALRPNFPVLSQLMTPLD